MSSVTSTTAVNNLAGTPSPSRAPARTLNQDDFLKLLVAQLTTQDPLNPKQDTEFIAQMAQFSSLEQSKSMQSDISRMRTEQQMLQANALLGRTVEVQLDKQTSITGQVSAVKVEAGTPKVWVNGQAYTLDKLTAITPSTN